MFEFVCVPRVQLGDRLWVWVLVDTFLDTAAPVISVFFGFIRFVNTSSIETIMPG